MSPVPKDVVVDEKAVRSRFDERQTISIAGHMPIELTPSFEQMDVYRLSEQPSGLSADTFWPSDSFELRIPHSEAMVRGH